MTRGLIFSCARLRASRGLVSGRIVRCARAAGTRIAAITRTQNRANPAERTEFRNGLDCIRDEIQEYPRQFTGSRENLRSIGGEVHIEIDAIEPELVSRKLGCPSNGIIDVDDFRFAVVGFRET